MPGPTCQIIYKQQGVVCPLLSGDKFLNACEQFCKQMAISNVDFLDVSIFVVIDFGLRFSLDDLFAK